MDKEIITQNLRRIRSEKNLTQSQVAERMGVTRKTYNLLENGRVTMRMPQLNKAAKALEVPSSQVFGYDGKQDSSALRDERDSARASYAQSQEENRKLRLEISRLMRELERKESFINSQQQMIARLEKQLDKAENS